jgi:FAD dependent oxidoreductase TIGR03364
MKKYDLVVVGGGVLGTFHAFHACRLGLRVHLIEKDSQPQGASVRNFGQVVPSGLSEGWFRRGVRSTQIYSELEEEAGIGVRNGGSLYVASDDAEVTLLHELKARMEARAYNCSLISRSQLAVNWPHVSTRYAREALYFPQEVSVSPTELVQQVVGYLRSRHSFFSYSPESTVVGCDFNGTGVHVQTNRGERLTAEKVVICNGAEFRLLFPEYFRASGIELSKLHMMKTVSMPQVRLRGNILTGLTIRRYESFSECPSFKRLQIPEHAAALIEKGIHILFKQADDGGIIIGDSHEYAPVESADRLGFHLDAQVTELLLAEAQRVAEFDVRRLQSSWTAVYSQHPTKDIVEFDFQGRLHVRTAIGGKGMTTSPGYAESNIYQWYC